MQDNRDFTGEAFLAAPLPTSMPQPLRQAVLEQTLTALRRRSWRKRGVWMAALAACYLAGMLTTWQLRPARPPAPSDPNTQVVQHTEPPRSLAPEPEENVPALVLENRAFDTFDGRRAALYRQAGDRYLNVERDLPSALRCYRQMLAAGSEADWVVRAEDSWLLMVVKDSFVKEKNHARGDG